MTKTRLEAFSDGVIAIIITIMVLELHAPDGTDLNALWPLLPVFLSYVLSFAIVGIYWNNHHHLLHSATRVSASVLWANLHLLFWLSLIPFTTAWIGEHHDAPLPTAAYGLVLLCAAIGYTILQSRIVAIEGARSRLASALGSDVKGKISLAMYSLSVVMAFVAPVVSDAIFVAVALIWFVPDRRIEAIVREEPRGRADYKRHA